MLKGKALKPGDTIAIIAPASAPQVPEKVTKSVEYFERLGYRVVVGKNIEHRYGYLAGTDKERLSDLHSMIADKKVKAIFMIRGGYGTSRLVPEINYELIKQNPKIIVGYSDATALFNAIYKKTGLQSLFFGPMPGVDIWNGFDAFAEECMWKALTSTKSFGELPQAPKEITPLKKNSNAIVEGRWLGGNLTVFSAIVGTPYLSSLTDKILLFEDVGEDAYRLDRYLSQLWMSGVLDSARAILLGQFSDCGTSVKSEPPLSVEQVFSDYFSKLTVPVLTNLPFGHIPRQWTIPLGAKLRIEKNMISIIESVLA
ncbi:MAG TPA: LD-carboxypeptidase [Candidatus Kapabacteria bacterium]|nr:LD-carboxypeptidase [Candidatus Kapabacteria bacterium]